MPNREQDRTTDLHIIQIVGVTNDDEKQIKNSNVEMKEKYNIG